MEIKGKVHEIGAVQQVSETFKKRDLIVEVSDSPEYPEYIRFEALQDKTALIDDLSVGAQIEVFFNLRGRPWTDKTGKTSYFNSLVIWRVNTLTSTPVSTTAHAAPIITPDDDGDLPF